MPPVHGRRVVGDDAYDKAVREEVGGVHTFGVRVRGAIPESGPTNIAKRATEHGPLVVAGAQFQDEKGKVGDSISIESLRNILAENPTFFDSLYEAELARPDGAREDALAIFYEVERGIKGAGRQDVLDEIRQLLGAKRQVADLTADRIQARLEHSAQQQKRMAENALLTDADRIESLADRAENLQRVKDAKGDDQLTTLSPMVETQMQGIAKDKGLDINTEGGAVTGNTPAKPEGSVKVQSQSTDSGDAGSGAKGSDEIDFDSMTKADLEGHLGDEVENVKGTGAEGAVLKADLVKHAKKLAKKEK